MGPFSPVNMTDLFLSAPQTQLDVGGPEGSKQPKRPAAYSQPEEPPAKKAGYGPNWAVLENIWPSVERPVSLQDPEWIEKQSIGDLMALQKVYLKKEQREQGQAIGRATKDTKPPIIKMDSQNAN